LFISVRRACPTDFIYFSQADLLNASDFFAKNFFQILSSKKIAFGDTIFSG